MQAVFLVIGAVFLAIGIATSVGSDVTLWGTFIAVGTVFLTLGLALDDGDGSGDDTPDEQR
ncbi:hypothetical protein [Haloarchaeobius litoreus]|uniref:Uncharacterized protein n=1 Tax=Haloarchaeobius litoreus TaxID=755306 RepID=A0ABD6DL65_9EURY|nr:hypothetical protein [Haloarchaeobius litoreus]